jgi:hypothetical protein
MRQATLYLFFILMLLSACRHDDYIIYSIDEDTGGKTVKSEIMGMYLLNEGNMGSNKCTLDYLDLSGNTETVHYYRNIYAERNPSTVKELGDVGNDLKIHDNKLWMVINCSNKVEVATADSCRRLAKIDIPNCRYITFDGNYAYVSSYVGPVQISTNTQLGRVYKIDTRTYQKVDSIEVGYQPEELCIVGNKLYVANSGGYRIPQYDHTISIIDLSAFKEEKKIDVADNLHRCRADHYNQLWVSSRGTYNGTPAKLFWLEPDKQGEMTVKDNLPVAVSDMCIVGDSLYFFGVEWSYVKMENEISYGIINVRTHQLITRQLSEAKEIESITLPYGLIVNPVHRDFYIMDAKNYVSSGELLHFHADGTFDWRVWTGDIPAHAVFRMKKQPIYNQ